MQKIGTMEFFILIFLLSFSTSTTFGNESSLGGALGTDGFGPQVAFRVSQFFTMRTGLAFLHMNIDVDSEDIKYEVSLNQAWLPVLIDYEVGGSNFRTTAGLAFNLNGISAEYTPTENVEVGEYTYTPEQLGHVEGDIDFSFVSPYLGIGLGIPVSGNPGFSICLGGGFIFSKYDCNIGYNYLIYI